MLRILKPTMGRPLFHVANISTKNSVLLRNLPVSTTLEKLSSAIGKLEVKSVQLQPGCSLHYLNADEAQAAVAVLSGNCTYQAEVVNSSIPCVDVDKDSYNSNLSKFIESYDLKPVTVLDDELSRSYRLPFATMSDAQKLAKAASGEAKSTKNAVRVSSLPTFIVQLNGVETSLSSLLEDLENKSKAKPFNIERSALISFKRNQHVISGIKNLKKIQVDGQNIKVEKYSYSRPSDRLSKNNFDNHVAFEEYSSSQFLQDNLTSDPATRFQIVKNAFERCLNDALARKDVSILTPVGTPFYEEANNIFQQLFERSNKEPTEKINQKLFEIFLRRQDISRFSEDFSEISSLLGPVDESDSFNWSQFRMETNDDVERLYLKAAELGEKAIEKNVNSALGETADITSSSFEAKKTTLLNPSILRDADGRMWSGVILDTDMVQKTMPGNRVGTHRALVAIGNLRGTAGFGMGKGKTSGDALNSAFRAAQRNLLHVDLYENFGLAHDIHGKHNSCHAYIRATPRSRKMVASPFASAILQRFGIGSASVKLVGRRDPYAMVRAIFDALSRHQNIDEYAKARGKRYLTQKWAHDNGL